MLVRRTHEKLHTSKNTTIASSTPFKSIQVQAEDKLESFWRLYDRLQKRSRSEDFNQCLKRKIDEVRLEQSGQAQSATSSGGKVTRSASDNNDYRDQANAHKSVKDADKEREDAKALLSAVQDLASCMEALYLMRDIPFDQIQVLRDKDMEFFFEPEMPILKMGLKTLVIGELFSL